MRDVLENARFQDEIKAKIKEFEEKIEYMEGPGVMGQILSALEQDKDNQDILQKRDQVEDAITINKKNLASQKEELTRINQFFASFNNSIVMIGPEEATFMDLAPTPFNKAPVPKVSVHGNLIKTLTTGKYLKRMSEGMNYLATFIVCIVMGGLAVYQGNRTSLVQAAGILLLIGYIGFGFFTFAETHVIWPITTPACAGLSTSFLGLAAMVVIEQKAKGKLKGMFGSYVSSDLVEQMVESGKEPQLGGEETAITAFFSDVQAFSSFSELLTPTGLVDLMNEYLTAMTNILQEERGTLDKYIGDAIVAMYGAPIPMNDHAYQAVKTAILMQQKQIELREKWVPEAEKWGKCHGLVTQMQTRIGCNTGTATVGNMGALDRFNYTMMGDMVNLAARCESGAKAYGAYIMVTEETKLASEALKDDIAFRYLDKIVVKGRSQPVAMYEPTGFMNELTQETQDCLDCFRQGIDKYLKQDWLGALSLFEKAKELEPNRPGVTPGVKDNPSMILIDRCKVMQENPPGDDWDGVYVMTTK
jgi:adenylate cyclase